MANKNSEVLLRYKLDKAALAEAQAGTRALESSLAGVDQAAKETGKTSQQTGNLLKNALGRSASESLDKVEKQAREAADAFDALRKSAAGAAQASDGVKAPPTGGGGKGLGGREAAGDISTSLGSIASVVGAGGSGPLSEILAFGGDLAGAFEYLPNLATALTSIGPLGIAAAAGIGLATFALSEINRTSADVTAGLREVIGRTEEYYDAINFGTEATIQAQLEEKRRAQANAQSAFDAVAGVEQAYQEAGQVLGVFTGAVIELGGALGDKSYAAVRDTRLEYDEARKALEAANTEVQRFEAALNDTGVAARTAAEAEAALAEQRTQGVLAEAQAVLERERLFQSSLNLSTQQIGDRLKAIAEESSALQSSIDVLNASGDTSEAVAARTAELQASLAKLSDEESLLITTAAGVAAAREQETRATDEAKKAAESAADQLDELAGATQKYNDDVRSIQEDALKRRADLEKSYADQQVSIAKKAADDAANALNNLLDQRTSLSRDLGRGEADAQRQAQDDALSRQIDFQREEAQAARDHARSLQKIREDAQEAEIDLIANRDFSGLFRSRRDTARNLRDANEQFGTDRGDRQRAFNEANADAQRQFAFEREQRLIKFQQDLADAQEQYNKERAQIEANRVESLVRAKTEYRAQQIELTNSLKAQLQARQQAAVQELRLIQQSESQRANIIAQTQNALIAQAQQMLAGIRSQAGAFGGGGASSGRTVVSNVTTNVRTGASASQVAGLSNMINQQVTRTVGRLVR